jgi:outer membrane biogenesis lipoprotein LolB
MCNIVICFLDFTLTTTNPSFLSRTYGVFLHVYYIGTWMDGLPDIESDSSVNDDELRRRAAPEITIRWPVERTSWRSFTEPNRTALQTSYRWRF